MYDFGEFKQKVKLAEEWLGNELVQVRTGRATPIVLDSIQVEVYGLKMGIKELANIVVEDARSIRVEPWDQGVLKAIEKAITTSSIGISISPFGKEVRIIFPELTAERREQLIKVVKQKLEEARVTLRGVRDRTWNEIQNREKKGDIGEDDKFRFKDEMQRQTDEANKRLDEVAERKMAEIRG